jgi:integrase/recombinase XerD
MSLTLTEAQTRFLRRCRAKGLTDRSMEFYVWRFNALARFLAAADLPATLDQLTPDVIRDFLADQQTVSANLSKQAFVTLRALFRFLLAEDLVERNPMQKVDVPKLPRPHVETFTPAHIEALLRGCGDGFLGIRDRALFLVLLDCGLRATELCTLKVDDVDYDEQVLHVWGKGNKARRVPFGEATRQALRGYLARRGTLPVPQFFVSAYGHPLDRHRLREMILARSTKAEITGVRCSPHTFRHTFAVMFLRSGGDVFSLQKLLGHSDLSMTRRYAELSDADVCAKHRAHSPGDQFLGVLPAAKRTRLR